MHSYIIGWLYNKMVQNILADQRLKTVGTSALGFDQSTGSAGCYGVGMTKDYILVGLPVCL